jgi:hypothetical protein
MKPIVVGGLLAAITSLLLSCAAQSAPSASIEVQTEDVTRFFRIYEAAGGRPTAEQLQREYLDRGTTGLRHLARVRNVTGERIARAVAAQKPPISIVVGPGKPLAIAGPGDGVQIGLEAMCSATAARFFDANIDDRFVHVIAHEYIHAQQAPALANNEHPSVLERSLLEGVAEFVGELISGGIANVAVSASASGRETEIEKQFAADTDKTDLSAWVDNTTSDSVGQLGYWVGYRIAKAYYRQAPDKRAAVREMIQLTKPRAFLAKSGWYPGIVLN